MAACIAVNVAVEDSSIVCPYIIESFRSKLVDLALNVAQDASSFERTGALHPMSFNCPQATFSDEARRVVEAGNVWQLFLIHGAGKQSAHVSHG